MVVGETLGLWLTEEAVRLGRFVDAAPDHRERLDRLPGRLEQVLARALALRSDDRFASAVGFADAVALAVEQRGPRYTDAELREIVGRAASLDAGRPTEEEPLLSIGGVEQVAAQVGIPPERVRQAMRELEVPGPRQARAPVPPPAPVSVPGPPAPAIGLRHRVFVERTANREIAEAGMSRLLEEVGRSFEQPGRRYQMGDAVIWRTVATGRFNDRTVQLTVTPRGGETLIAVEEHIAAVPGRAIGAVVGWVSGLLLGIAFGVGLGSPDLSPFTGLLFSVGGAYFAARSVRVDTVMRREQELGALADHLRSLVESGAAGAVDPWGAPGRPRLPGEPAE